MRAVQRLIKGHAVALCAVATLGAVLPEVAEAAHVTESVANAHVGGVCCNPFDFTLGIDPTDPLYDLAREGPVAGPSEASASVLRQELDSSRPSGWLYRQQSAAWARSEAGVLRAEASAGYFTDGFRTFDSVTARAVARFEDVLRVEGSGSGSVDVALVFRVSGALGGVLNSAYAMGGLSLLGSSVIDFRQADPGAVSRYTCHSVLGAGDCLGQIILRLPANTDLPMSGYLGVVASAVGVPGRDNASAHFGRTAFVEVAVLTPGFTLRSDSGYEYASAVPEPATWALLLAGSAMVSACSARRVRRQSALN